MRESRARQIASLMLLISTVFWGCGFAWSKQAADVIGDALVAPILILALRFGIGGILWLAMFREARTGWTWKHVRRAALIGFLLAGQMASQVVGLLYTGAGIAAFLTSLTVLFVPLILTTRGKSPGLVAWIGVILATIGVWIMTGAGASGFQLGQLLGLGSALGCAIYILAVNKLVPIYGADRMAAGQFIGCAIFCTLVVLPFHSTLPAVKQIFSNYAFARDVGLLTFLSTLVSYGLLTHFQPRVDATRAALLYLAEPIFAAVYARILLAEDMSGKQIAGAALILVANLLVEIVAVKPKT